MIILMQIDVYRFRTKKHPSQKQDLLNQKLLEELDKKNVFDIEDYIKRKGKVKLNRNTVITRL